MEPHHRYGRSEVVDRAAQLLDEYGIADLTMRRLARELGLTPGALYWHFSDKQELLGAVADRILAPAAQPIERSPWAQRILAIGTALRDALLSSTDGAELVSATFASGRSHALGVITGHLVDAAGDAGFDPGDAELAARTVVYYVLGFTADEQSRLQWDAAGALAATQSVWDSNANGRFAFGLNLMIDGMSAQKDADQRTSGRCAPVPGLESSGAQDGVDTGVTIPSA